MFNSYRAEGKLALKIHGFNIIIIITYNWFPLIHNLVFVSFFHCCHVDNYVWFAQQNKNNDKNSHFIFNNGSNDLISNQACII